MEPLFCVRQLVEKYREMNEKLCMMFIDLENAYDRVSREVLTFKVGVNQRRGPKNYINLIRICMKV